MTIILVSWEEKIGRIAVWTSLGKKYTRLHLTMSGCGSKAPIIPAMREVSIRKLVQASPGINVRPYVRNYQGKKGWWLKGQRHSLEFKS
jgi:hypothetical protein